MTKASIREIQEAVAAEFGVTLAALCGGGRTAAIIKARFCAMVLARELTGHSLETIGSRFGGRDHATVLNALCRLPELAKLDPVLAGMVDRVRGTLAKGAGHD